jgi:hypothetical protein
MGAHASAGAQTQTVPTPPSFSPGKSSPSRRSRSSHTILQKEKDGRKEGGAEIEDADKPSNDITSIPGTGNGAGSTVDVASTGTLSRPPLQPSGSSTIDPLSQVKGPGFHAILPIFLH